MWYQNISSLRITRKKECPGTDHPGYTVHAIRKITIFNGQITVILSYNSLKQYINQEDTYPQHFIEIGQKRNNNGF